MLTLGFFEFLGKVFENFLFLPYDFFRLILTNWWSSNLINWLFLILGFVAFFYWMGQMSQFKRQGKEDSA